MIRKNNNILEICGNCSLECLKEFLQGERERTINTVFITKEVAFLDTKLFQDLNSLNFPISSILVEDGNKHFLSVDGVLYTKDKKTLISYPVNKQNQKYIVEEETEIMLESSFSSSKNLVSIVLSDKTKKIEDYVFANCMNLQNIVLPRELISIGKSAFSRCICLLTITIPPNVQELDHSAFESCSNLARIIFERSVKKVPLPYKEYLIPSTISRRLKIFVPDEQTQKAYKFELSIGGEGYVNRVFVMPKQGLDEI